MAVCSLCNFVKNEASSVVDGISGLPAAIDQELEGDVPFGPHHGERIKAAATSSVE